MYWAKEPWFTKLFLLAMSIGLILCVNRLRRLARLLYGGWTDDKVLRHSGGTISDPDLMAALALKGAIKELAGLAAADVPASESALRRAQARFRQSWSECQAEARFLESIAGVMVLCSVIITIFGIRENYITFCEDTGLKMQTCLQQATDQLCKTVAYELSVPALLYGGAGLIARTIAKRKSDWDAFCSLRVRV